MSNLILTYVSGTGMLYVKRTGLLPHKPIIFAEVIDTYTSMSSSNYNSYVVLRSNVDNSKITTAQFIQRPNYVAFYLSARAVKMINESPANHSWYFFGLPSTVTGFFANWSYGSTEVGCLNLKDTAGFIQKFPLSQFQFDMYVKLYNLTDS